MYLQVDEVHRLLRFFSLLMFSYILSNMATGPAVVVFTIHLHVLIKLTELIWSHLVHTLLFITFIKPFDVLKYEFWK